MKPATGHVDWRFQQLRFPCQLPPDARGVPSGAAYRPMLVAGRDNTYGTGWNPSGLKAGRRMQCLSTLERNAVYRFEVDPDVLDIREQYPIYDPHRLGSLLADGRRRIARSAVATLDLLLTRRDAAATTGLSYQAVCVKYVSELAKADVQRRLEREQGFCRQHGWQWTLLTEREVPRELATSARVVCRIAAGHDLESLRGRAFDAAQLLLHRSPGTTLRATQAKLIRALKVPADQALPLIAAAVLYGYLKLDLTQPLTLERPLALLQQVRYEC